MDYEHLRLDIQGHLAKLTLCRPESLNALNMQALVELRSALKQVIASPARCLVLTGEGRAFCSGVDLNAPRDGLDPGDPDEFLRDYFVPPFRLLAEMKVPTIAAVNGPCAGAGMSLALTCDLVVAADTAYFLQPFANIGLVPDLGSSWLIPQAIGRARAAGLMLLGEKLSASDAAAWGLIWDAVPADRLDDAISSITSKFTEGPSESPQWIKQLITAAPHNDLAAQMRMEIDLQRVAIQSEDHLEARKAFREKRPAVFRSRR